MLSKLPEIVWVVVCRLVFEFFFEFFQFLSNKFKTQFSKMSILRLSIVDLESRKLKHAHTQRYLRRKREKKNVKLKLYGYSDISEKLLHELRTIKVL